MSEKPAKKQAIKYHGLRVIVPTGPGMKDFRVIVGTVTRTKGGAYWLTDGHTYRDWITKEQFDRALEWQDQVTNAPDEAPVPGTMVRIMSDDGRPAVVGDWLPPRYGPPGTDNAGELVVTVEWLDEDGRTKGKTVPVLDLEVVSLPDEEDDVQWTS